MPELRARAPAKINLVLEVLGRREDGYHEIDTVLQELVLADEVAVSFDGPPGIRVTGPHRSGVPDGAANQAWRAAVALAARVGADASRIGITIEKNIPAAGGLGGGSSDAAATLRLLQHAWPGVTAADILAAATSVGSDEAFFLTGGTARATGRGETVAPVPPIATHGVVLFLSPETLERKTARLFAALSERPFDDGSAVARFLARPPEKAALSCADIFNAFERVAFDVFPGLGELRDRIQAAIGVEVRLAGAGPTLFWIGPQAERDAIAGRAGGLPCAVVPTQTASAG